VIQHWPGKGAWTYHLVIPNSRDIPGTWGHLKVSGTLDDYAVQGRNLAPRKNEDKMLSLNATIRQHLGKQAGDSVRVTLYQEAANLLNEEADVLACLEDANVLAQFRARSGEDR
jgi:citrate lyase gamma subunit